MLYSHRHDDECIPLFLPLHPSDTLSKKVVDAVELTGQPSSSHTTSRLLDVNKAKSYKERTIFHKVLHSYPQLITLHVAIYCLQYNTIVQYRIVDQHNNNGGSRRWPRKCPCGRENNHGTVAISSHQVVGGR